MSRLGHTPGLPLGFRISTSTGGIRSSNDGGGRRREYHPGGNSGVGPDAAGYLRPSGIGSPHSMQTPGSRLHRWCPSVLPRQRPVDRGRVNSPATGAASVTDVFRVRSAAAARARTGVSRSRLASAGRSSTIPTTRSPSPTATQVHPEMGVSWFASRSAPPTRRAAAAIRSTLGSPVFLTF